MERKTRQLVEDQSLLQRALGKCWRLTAELLPPKWPEPLDLVEPQLKKRKKEFMIVKTKRISVQALKGASLRGEPGLGVGIPAKRTTALGDTGESSVVVG